LNSASICNKTILISCLSVLFAVTLKAEEQSFVVLAGDVFQEFPLDPAGVRRSLTPQATTLPAR